jgi:hypothetical protein
MWLYAEKWIQLPRIASHGPARERALWSGWMGTISRAPISRLEAGAMFASITEGCNWSHFQTLRMFSRQIFLSCRERWANVSSAQSVYVLMCEQDCGCIRSAYECLLACLLFLSACACRSGIHASPKKKTWEREHMRLKSFLVWRLLGPKSPCIDMLLGHVRCVVVCTCGIGPR